MGKECKRCGADISHHKHGGVKYCKPEDGGGMCARGRNTEDKRKSALKAAQKRDRRCPVCGGLIMGLKAKTCSRPCSVEFLSRGGSPQPKKPVLNLDHWPYKLPYDPVVIPADICPLN